MDYLLQFSIPISVEFPPNSGIFIGFLKSSILLKHLKIPEIQREVNQDRVDEIECRLCDEYDKNNFFDFGTLLLCDYDDNLYLLNGQHRYCALKSITQKHNLDIPIKVEVRRCQSKNDMEKLWRISNDSREVKLVKNSNHQLILNGLRKHLNTKYPKYISEANKPHKPHINLNNLIEEIENINFPEYLLQKLIHEIENINNFYKENQNNMDLWKKWRIPSIGENLEKCRLKDQTKTLYLGIFQNFEWLYRIKEHLENNIPYELMPHQLITTSSRKISRKTSFLVWDKYNSFEKIKERGDNFATCFVCRKRLEQENFQCGHVVPFFYGGKNSVDNLEPICSSCNQAMGIENLYVYKNREFPT